MRRNIMAIGDRTLCGKYGRVLSAGEINIYDSIAKSIYGAGDVSVSKSTIGKLRGAGEITVDSSTIKDFKGVGEVNLSGVCKSDKFVGFGDVRAEFLEAGIIVNGFNNKNVVVNGMKNTKWQGSFRAETFESAYDIYLNFDYDFDHIISTGNMRCDDEIVCEKFYSFNSLNANAINAENIFILLNQDIKVDYIFASTVKISSRFIVDEGFKNIKKSLSYKNMDSEKNVISLKSIEADHIHVECVKAEYISGNDVVIGDLCIIDRVEYKNTLKVSKKAVIGEVIKG